MQSVINEKVELEQDKSKRKSKNMKLKWDDTGMKAPLARAKGLGSARGCVEHWMHQRITALALVPLVIWFVYSIVKLAGADYASFTNWLAQPLNAILMILLIVAGFYHAALGTQVIAEDYIHHEGLKMAKLIGIKLFFIGLGVVCVFSILKVAFTVGV